MPDDLVFRPPRPDEAQAVADLLNACSVAEIGVPDTSVEEVRSSWSRPDCDPASDLSVAEEGGRIVGYLEVEARDPISSLRIDGYVHPEAMGRGIGSALLERGEARARALAAQAAPGDGVALFHGVWHDTPGARLLQSHGFELARVYWRMRIDMAAPPPAPTWPNGISVRGVAPDEEAAVHAADEEAFADHWQHRPVAFDRWLHDLVNHPASDRSLWFVAVDGEKIAGGVLSRRFDSEEPDCAYVDDLFVRRPWRRRGIAGALLQHAFRQLFLRGIHKAALDVDSENPTGATGVYERVGMRVQRRIDVYRKELVPAPSDVTPEA